LELDHKGHTEIRFTLNTDKVIKDYESRTPSMKNRLEASVKIARAGYPLGFIIAPVFLYENWREDYRNLLNELSELLPEKLAYPVTFEVISHRYTTRAKNIINEVFPEHTLPMVDEDRSYKYGQFGYGKFVYPKEDIKGISEFFHQEIDALFHNKEIKYII
jgi:spore photoproduct lyase